MTVNLCLSSSPGSVKPVSVQMVLHTSIPAYELLVTQVRTFISSTRKLRDSLPEFIQSGSSMFNLL